MAVRTFLAGWPVYRQLTGTDPLGRGAAAAESALRGLWPAHRYRRPGRPSGLPLLRGRLRPAGLRPGRAGHPDRGRPRLPDQPWPAVPEGSAPRKQLVTGPQREQKVLYRAPYATDWTELELDTAMDMVADRVLEARHEGLAGRRPHDHVAAARIGHRQPRRRDPGQRRELPDQEAVHGAGRDPDREPGPHLTLRHRPRSGDLVRAWRRHQLPGGPGRLATASSSWARTWPRPIRSGSSG